MLPSSPHVQSVYTEADGILPALKQLPPKDVKQTLFIDSTTLDVKVARQVAADIIHTGAQMVDAPVSGGQSFLLYFISRSVLLPVSLLHFDLTLPFVLEAQV